MAQAIAYQDFPEGTLVEEGAGGPAAERAVLNGAH
jgi:hypothetical protein